MLKGLAGAFGAIALLFASSLAAAQVTLPKGIFYLTDPDAAIAASALAPAYVDGASLRYKWATLEPGWGTYNFAPIDRDLSTVGAAHKHAQILLMVGQQTPCWVENLNAGVYAGYPAFHTNCANHFSETFALADTAHKTVVPLPWDSVYQAQLKHFIFGLASHLASRGELATVTGVVASGIALGTTETRLPNPTDSSGWAAAGYTRANVESAFTSIFGYWSAAFPNAGVSTRFLYDSFPQGFGACHTPDNLFPRELIDIAYGLSPTQAIIGNNGLNNNPTINAGSGPGNLLPQMCAISRGPGNLWQDCQSSKENCINGTDANTFQGSALTPAVAYEGLQEDGPETNTFAAEWAFADAAYTKLLFIEVYPDGFTAANAAALMDAHNELTQ